MAPWKMLAKLSAVKYFFHCVFCRKVFTVLNLDLKKHPILKKRIVLKKA